MGEELNSDSAENCQTRGAAKLSSTVLSSFLILYFTALMLFYVLISGPHVKLLRGIVYFLFDNAISKESALLLKSQRMCLHLSQRLN